MPKKDIILSSSSQWASPIVLVPSNKEMYKGTLGDHGREKNTARIRERLYWPEYHIKTANYSKTNLQFCQRKTPSPNGTAPLQSIKVGFPMQLVAVDIIGPFHE